MDAALHPFIREAQSYLLSIPNLKEIRSEFRAAVKEEMEGSLQAIIQDILESREQGFRVLYSRVRRVTGVCCELRG